MTIDIAAAVNKPEILQRDLASSPCIGNFGLTLRTYEGCASASSAYNKAISDTSARILVLAHQDIYLPRPWLNELEAAIKLADSEYPDWGVMGLFGINKCGGYIGRVWSTGLGRELNFAETGLRPAQSLDEIVLIIRTDKKLLFDERLPGFHLFGTDIVQTCWKLGLTPLIATIPVVHNSAPVRSLGGDFAEAYRYLAKKWRKELPIRTPVTTISRSGLALSKQRMLLGIRSLRQTKFAATDFGDGRAIAQKLGYEESGE